MSVSLSYFFNYDGELPAMAEAVNTVIGSSLRPSVGAPESAYTSFLLGMEFSLGLTTYDYDDGDIRFSNYKFEIDFTTYWGMADARPIQLVALLSVVYLLYCRLGIIGMLVYDVQILLAQYTEQDLEGHGKCLYDVLSQEAFVSLPAHLATVRRRLPVGSWLYQGGG